MGVGGGGGGGGGGWGGVGGGVLDLGETKKELGQHQQREKGRVELQCQERL